MTLSVVVTHGLVFISTIASFVEMNTSLAEGR
jgi:hypothetical protein